MFVNALASTSKHALRSQRVQCIFCGASLQALRPLVTYRFNANSTTAARPTARPAQQLRDESIPSQYIRVVQGDEQGGGLGPLVRKEAVLKGLDRSTHWLQQVNEQAMTDEDLFNNRIRGYRKYAVCKIISKKAAFEKAKEKQAAQRERKKSGVVDEKEVQLTWGVSANDLSHKLKKARQIVEKGGRLTLGIVTPKKTQAPHRSDREMFVQTCKEMLGDTEPWKPEEWKGSSTVVHLQARKSSLKEAATDSARSTAAVA